MFAAERAAQPAAQPAHNTILMVFEVSQQPGQPQPERRMYSEAALDHTVWQLVSRETAIHKNPWRGICALCTTCRCLCPGGGGSVQRVEWHRRVGRQFCAASGHPDMHTTGHAVHIITPAIHASIPHEPAMSPPWLQSRASARQDMPVLAQPIA